MWFELKKWTSNNNEIFAEILEDLNSVSNTKKTEVKSNTEWFSVLGLQLIFTDYTL